MSSCASTSCRRVLLVGRSFSTWHSVQGKAPSENGGGGGCTRIGPAGFGMCGVADGTRCNAAVPSSRTQPASSEPSTVTTPIAGRKRLGMGGIHHLLHLAQPHRLKDLEPLTDEGRDVPRDGVTDE